MKNPFPGMNPYLEAYWSDVHSKLAAYISDKLNPGLPKDLVARTEVYVGLFVEEQHEMSFSPDVSLIETNDLDTDHDSGGVATLTRNTTKPRLYRMKAEPRKQKRVVIREAADDGRLITAIEILSPTNKSTIAEQELYIRKRQEFLQAGVSMVEIDLLRAGTSVLFVPAAERHRRDPADYYVSVVRGWRQSQAEVYPIQLMDRLPTISIPLRKTDADASLDLQELIDMAYLNGAYSRSIRYGTDVVPPLTAEQAAWSKRVVGMG